MILDSSNWYSFTQNTNSNFSPNQDQTQIKYQTIQHKTHQVNTPHHN